MLIEAPIKEGDVVTIKTIGGDEIIARMHEVLPNSYKIIKPLAIMATAQGLGLAPYAFTVNPDSKLEVRNSAIVFIAKTDSDMAKQYLSSTTGIKMV